jgi:hypothetical protein
MRLWSLHPRHLDPAGLVALWRETLLAKAVLTGKTKGYKHHPQLDRFKATRHPAATLNAYLAEIHAEAVRRGYSFDKRKLAGPKGRVRLTVNRDQLAFEWSHLLKKLRVRSPERYSAAKKLARPSPHPLFTVRRGPIATWERP